MKNISNAIGSAFIAILIFSFIATQELESLPLQSSPNNTPIGTIIAWPGPPSTWPDGWLECNGDGISSESYPKLCDVLLDYWGPRKGDNSRIHILPDLRGVFLRGTNGSRDDSYSDPEAQSRSASNGRKNEVGSYQSDAFQEHTIPHQRSIGPGLVAECGNCAGVFHSSREEQNIVVSGAKETRPSNANVYFLIKSDKAL